MDEGSELEEEEDSNADDDDEEDDSGASGAEDFDGDEQDDLSDDDDLLSDDEMEENIPKSKLKVNQPSIINSCFCITLYRLPVYSKILVCLG